MARELTVHEPLGVLETFGLSPLTKTAREIAFALRGDPLTPGTKFGPSSLRVFKPRLALAQWLRRIRSDGRVPIYNLFNRTQTPIQEGWSVRVTQVRDFRGGSLTYDSHNGTDFAVPVGTEVVAAAPGRVLRVSSEFHRGGLKVIVDHGRGLVTTSNHLSRALVRPGQSVLRGQPIALSGASGIDMLFMFPWNAPHVHFNVWLNGEPVDPFAAEGETALWRNGNHPGPARSDDEVREPTEWSLEGLDEAANACLDPELARELGARTPVELRAGDTLFALNYTPTRFAHHPDVYATRFPREPRLDLPFARFTGVAFPDD